MRISMGACATLAALGLAACGDEEGADRFGGEQREVAAAVERLRSAAERGDSSRICRELLAREARVRLGRTCPARIQDALDALDDTGLEVAAVRLEGDQAVATVVGGSGEGARSGDLRLVREASSWRLLRVGPLPPLPARRRPA